MLVLKNCRLFDGRSADIQDGRDILIDEGVIREVGEGLGGGHDAIDAGGRFVMPGLIDAHVHAYGIDLNPNVMDRMTPGLRALHARRILEDTLLRGFTTVRDAAGGDIALARGLDLGLIRGPRLFYPGLAVSQTGGHGDMRAPEHFDGCACGYCGAMTVLADGPDEMRKAVREQLRQGAHQIKLFVSGGVLSPADPLWMNQFALEEIRVAVEEAATRRTYVMAHAHTNEATVRCIGCGVRSIEHATMLEQSGVDAIVGADAFAVPTLVIIDAIHQAGGSLGLPPAKLDKMREVAGHALGSLDLLQRGGARIGFGTDLMGPLVSQQSREFSLRAQVCAPIDILRQATSINAELLQREGELGVIASGAAADILVIDGDPLADISVLEDPARLALIMKAGEVVRRTLA